MVEKAVNIWADGPVSEPYQPRKDYIRDWGTWLESVVTASLSAGSNAVFSTQALLNAKLTYAADSMAWVIGDTVPGNNGIYKKNGASGAGSWTRVSDLPFSFIVAVDAGAGTENAIQATSSLPVSASALVWMQLAKTNTSAAVTVSFNGTTSVPIRTSSGIGPAAGSLKAGMIVLGIRTGSTFQLLSDIASEAIQVACQDALKSVAQRSLGPFASSIAADAYAVAAGFTKVQGTTFYNTASSLWFYWDGSAWQAFPYSTIADGALTAAKFPATSERVSLAAIRRRLRAVPDLGDYGINSSGSTNYGQSDFDAMITALKADGYRNILVPAGNFRLGEQVTIADGVVFEGESKSASVFKFYHANSAFVFTGANENGGALKKLSIVNDSNALAAAYVQLVAAVGGTSPDFFVIEDCNMTCFNSGTMSYGVVANGNARDGSAPNALVGIRNLRFANTDIFNCTVGNVDFRHAKAPQMSGVRFFQAGGSLTKLIVGGTDASKATTNLSIFGSTLGDVAIGFASKVIAAGCDIADVTLGSGSSSCRLGSVFGTVSNAGSGNSWTT